MDEFKVDIPGSKYNECIIVDEYNGEFSLVVGREGTDGKIYKKWVFPQNRDRQPTEKAIPLKITIGSDRKSAIDTLRQIAVYLKPKE